jgi:hypothetical protein
MLMLSGLCVSTYSVIVMRKFEVFFPSLIGQDMSLSQFLSSRNFYEISLLYICVISCGNRVYCAGFPFLRLAELSIKYLENCETIKFSSRSQFIGSLSFAYIAGNPPFLSRGWRLWLHNLILKTKPVLCLP